MAGCSHVDRAKSSRQVPTSEEKIITALTDVKREIGAFSCPAQDELVVDVTEPSVAYPEDSAKNMVPVPIAPAGLLALWSVQLCPQAGFQSAKTINTPRADKGG